MEKYSRLKEKNNEEQPKEIRELIAGKGRSRRCWPQTRTPADKTRLNNLSLHLTRENQEVNNEFMNSYLRDMEDEERNEKTNTPIRKKDGSWARDDEQKAELFADYLEEIFQANEQKSRNEDQLTLSEENEEITSVTPKEVDNEIKLNINPRKAPGFNIAAYLCQSRTVTSNHSPAITQQ
jgi:predicted DNA-binding protein